VLTACVSLDPTSEGEPRIPALYRPALGEVPHAPGSGPWRSGVRRFSCPLIGFRSFSAALNLFLVARRRESFSTRTFTANRRTEL
jgi:hypothetical protein